MEEDRYIRITLRIPRDLHSRLDKVAEQTSKSLNAEIVGRLEESFATPASSDLKTELQISSIRNRIALLDMRFEVTKSRLESFEFRTQLTELESGRQMKEAQTDGDFKRAQDYLSRMAEIERDAMAIRDEMADILEERMAAVAEFSKLTGVPPKTSKRLEERIQAIRAAQAAEVQKTAG